MLYFGKMFTSVSIFRKLIDKHSRKLISTNKFKIEMEDQLAHDIKSEKLKFRRHPGRRTVNCVEFPTTLATAITYVLQDYSSKSIFEKGKLFRQKLKGRLLPIEKNEVPSLRKEFESRIQTKRGIDVSGLERDEQEAVKISYQDEVNRMLASRLNNWKPVNYDENKGLEYLLVRAAPDYAVLIKVLSEIKFKHPEFIPNTLMDFGSGVGTVTWAVRNLWENSLKEIFNVDSSSHMNDIASLILRNGKENEKLPFHGIFYRQFLPASHSLQFDLVVSAYTLLELPSQQTRIETILNLWCKTKQYLVLVEQGSNSGFQAIIEARDAILHLQKNSEQETEDCHVVAPCPHEFDCPRLTVDQTPCNFIVKHFNLPIHQKKNQSTEYFCYVIIKRGKRSADDMHWPRVVRESIVRSRHCHSEVCTSQGTLNNLLFSISRHGQTAYRCARVCKWGDLLPMRIDVLEEEEEKNKKIKENLNLKMYDSQD